MALDMETIKEEPFDIRKYYFLNHVKELFCGYDRQDRKQVSFADLGRWNCSDFGFSEAESDQLLWEAWGNSVHQQGIDPA